MLDYVGQVVRPPSEADSIILQATLGCSHNRCTFCPTYMNKRFALKDPAIVAEDIERAARYYRGARRLFVADGDALIMPMDRWVWLLDLIAEKLPWIERIGAYATGKSVRKKTDEELALLREKGLKILYLGVESGDDETLRYIKKDSTADELVEAGRRIRAAGMKLSVTVLLGIAPTGRSLDHARNTGALLTRMDPNFVGALMVMLCEGTPMEADARAGRHHVPDKMELLAELREMVAHTDLSRGLFMANHASNYLPLKIRMPGQKQDALALLDQALRGEVALKPEHYRAL